MIFSLRRGSTPSTVLGPDLRVLILLEYPGVSPRGSLVKSNGERSGRAEGLPRSGYHTLHLPKVCAVMSKEASFITR